MPKIIDRVIAKRILITTNPGAAQANQDLAVAAVIGGIRSTAWERYMRQFADDPAVNPAQLSRLLATDGTEDDPELNKKRAYMVGDGVCGGGTGFRFGQEVPTIDINLADNCDPTP